MQVIDVETVTDIEAAREQIMDLQKRLFRAENCLDDLARSVEIAQCTRQYQVTEVFVNEAMELLKDRIVIDIPESNGPQITMVEGSDEAMQKGLDIYNEDHGQIDNRKHESITGHVDLNGDTHYDTGRR